MNSSLKSRLLSTFGVNKKNKNTEEDRSQESAASSKKQNDQQRDDQQLVVFWRKQLHNAPSMLDLPRDHMRSDKRSAYYADDSLFFDLNLSQSIYTLAEHEGVSIQTVLLASYFALLFRYTGQEDIIVVSPYRKRDKHEGNKDSVTPLKDIVFYRWSNSAATSFRETIHNLQRTVNIIQTIGPAPIQDLANNADRSEEIENFGKNTIFQLAFDLKEGSNKASELLDLSQGLELLLAVDKQSNGLIVRLYYDRASFRPSTIQRMLEHYQNLLASAVCGTTKSISQLSIMTEKERKKILTEWNNTKIDFPILNSVHELFESKVQEKPNAEAIVFGDTRLSYDELNKKANQLAHYLRARGVGPGFLVGIYMERCADAVIALLGILKAGGTYLPLDASYPEERLRYILQDAGTKLLLTHEHQSTELNQVSNTLVYLDSNWGNISAYGDDNPVNLSHFTDTAFILYTSGSTGSPKGVQVTHGNLTNYFFIWEHTHHLSTSISAICQMTFFSFAVFQGDVIRALCSGNKLVLCSREVLMSPRKLYELMRREKVDFAEFVPVLLRGLVNYVKEVGKDLRFMNVMVVGADRWYLREHRDVQKLCANERSFVHVYGLSETTLDSTYFLGTDAELSENQMVPIGRPFPNVRVYILDSHMQPVPIGVAGELYIGGYGVAKGYHNRAGLSAEKFIPNPYGNSQNDRLFSTGDYARYLDDGNIFFLGRRDQQIKIRGFRVELGEIEARMEQHPAVEAAIVQPWEPRAGITQLVGYFVVEHASKLSNDEIRDFLEGKLPDFMVPSHFIELESMPLTPSSKINRNALPLPTNVDDQRDSIALDFADELQQTILQICSHALGVANLNPQDEFDRMGADSMAYMTMVSGIENAFGIVIEEEEINETTFASINSLILYVNSKT